MVDKTKGTQKLVVKEKVGSATNYICCFRGSRLVYGDGEGLAPALDPIAETGVALANGTNGLGAGFPVFDTAELLRKGVIYDVIITYQDGQYIKSHRVIVSKSKLTTFMTNANKGILKFKSMPVLSASLSQTSFAHL